MSVFNLAPLELRLYVINIFYMIVTFFFSLFSSSIENNEGKLILTPEMDGDTYVNGQVVIIINNILPIVIYF